MSNAKSVLPRHIDPRKFAQQGICLQGIIAVADLARFSALLHSQDAQIALDLQFGLDEQGVNNLQGKAEAELSVLCQRCLEPMTYVLQAGFQLAMLWREDQSAAVGKSWDPWVVGEGAVDIYPVIEDELILSLPLVNYHETLCIPQADYECGDLGSETSAQATNPFQVLSQMKHSLPKSTPDE